MKQYLAILFILFFLNPSFGQKKLEIPESQVIHSFIEKLPENLKEFKLADLRVSTDSLNIRIWQSHEIFSINHNNAISSDYTIFTNGDKLIFASFNFTERISNNILDSLLASGIMNLKNENYRGIDGNFVLIEISTKSKYKIVSFWSPNPERSNDCKTVIHILDMLDKTISSTELQNGFLNLLEPGGYRWGMTSIRIDRFLNKGIAKTDFYSQIEEKIKTELNITEETNHWDYPLILVNNKPAKIADLNNYTDRDISKLEIIKPDNELIALYGTNGSNGVVKLETK
ncbi:MAG: hypothetical protein QM786_13830 [Breznakibacter sp.]